MTTQHTQSSAASNSKLPSSGGSVPGVVGATIEIAVAMGLVSDLIS